MTSEEAFLVLNLLPQVGASRVRGLLDRFNHPEAILTAPVDQLRKVNGIGKDLATSIASWEETIDLDRELRRIDEVGATIVTMDSPDYPKSLREIHSPPLVLYVLGKLDPVDEQSIAIVGSRRATAYGLASAKKIGFQLAHARVTIVSGLARGIDTAAHEAAVAAKGRTVAVIGSGLGKLYPPENQALADRIVESGGAVVTEFPVDYNPDKLSFPLRNRIVAGWVRGVLVVEAPKRSGALITAGQALEAGRNIYAIPGGIDRPSSQGCNALIQSGAKLVADAGDILEDFDMLFSSDSLAQTERPSPSGLSAEEQQIYEALDASETQLDDIIDTTGLSPSVVSSTLLRLQMKKLVQQLPGNYFVKLI